MSVVNKLQAPSNPGSSLTVVTWNVNGLRAILGKGFGDFLDEVNPDIVCLQEIKVQPQQMEGWLPAGYEVFWNSAIRPGYSGTLALTKRKPVATSKGFGGDNNDIEGRVLTLSFDDFYLVNVYTPNVKRDLSRLNYRYTDWDPKFRDYLKGLASEKPVIFCGDLNVAHQEIDLANPKTNVGNAGFTIEEREGFSKILSSGFVDVFRHFESGPGHYTWWSYRTNARARNVGWRIDYFGISPILIPRVMDCKILPKYLGSDHCPVMLKILN